jgi:hypothetical protein
VTDAVDSRYELLSSTANTAREIKGAAIKGVIERETRFYITSLVMLALLLGPVICSPPPSRDMHWAIENSPHWVLDMVFRNDESRVRTNHAPVNFTTIKHMAPKLLRRPSGKDSFRLRRKVAGSADEFLASLVAT